MPRICWAPKIEHKVGGLVVHMSLPSAIQAQEILGEAAGSRKRRWTRAVLRRCSHKFSAPGLQPQEPEAAGGEAHGEKFRKTGFWSQGLMPSNGTLQPTAQLKASPAVLARQLVVGFDGGVGIISLVLWMQAPPMEKRQRFGEIGCAFLFQYYVYIYIYTYMHMKFIHIYIYIHITKKKQTIKPCRLFSDNL